MKTQHLADSFLFRVGYIGTLSLLLLGMALPGFPFPRFLYFSMALINVVALICIFRSRRSDKQIKR